MRRLLRTRHTLRDYTGIATFVSNSATIAGFSLTGERITQKIRENYLQAIF